MGEEKYDSTYSFTVIYNDIHMRVCVHGGRLARMECYIYKQLGNSRFVKIPSYLRILNGLSLG